MRGSGALKGLAGPCTLEDFVAEIHCTCSTDFGECLSNDCETVLVRMMAECCVELVPNERERVMGIRSWREDVPVSYKYSTRV